MDALYFSIGGLIFAVSIFKRDLLIQKESFKIFLGLSAVIFSAGVIIHLTDAGRDSACGALLCPAALGFANALRLDAVGAERRGGAVARPAMVFEREGFPASRRRTPWPLR